MEGEHGSPLTGLLCSHATPTPKMAIFKTMTFKSYNPLSIISTNSYMSLYVEYVLPATLTEFVQIK